MAISKHDSSLRFGDKIKVLRVISLRNVFPSLLLMVMLISTGCRDKIFDVENVAEILKNAGYGVSQSTQEGVPFVWQDKGAKYDVDGEPLVIFRYKLPRRDMTGNLRDNLEEGKKLIELILEKETGLWQTAGVDSEELYYQNGRILVFLGGHTKTVAIKKLLDVQIPCQPTSRLDCL